MLQIKKKMNTLTYARSVSTNSNITFRSFSASVSCRDGVNIAFETDDATEPVGLDFLVSCGDRQKPVTWKLKVFFLLNLIYEKRKSIYLI